MTNIPPHLSGIISPDVPLAPLTTWKIGGPAKWLAEPRRSDLPPLFEWITSERIPYAYLGRGSNILVPDEGFPGVVILLRNSMAEVTQTSDTIVAESGVSLPRLAKTAAKAGSRGFEFLIGIPGTVGGALAINAGLTVFRPREIAAVVSTVEYLAADRTFQTSPYLNFHPGYRSSDFLTNGYLITRAWFPLGEKGNPDDIHRDTLRHLADRKSKQPLDKPTAGSTFKQPPAGKPAGFYIEQAGLKGYKIGNVRVSPKHANWVENLGGGTEREVRMLLDHVKQTVMETFGIELKEEVRHLTPVGRHESER